MNQCKTPVNHFPSQLPLMNLYFYLNRQPAHHHHRPLSIS